MNHSGEFTYPDAKTPAKRTYWVVQNKLLAGAYPGQPDPAKHLARLQALYDAGMRTFINLQEEGENNNTGQPFVRYDGDLRDIAVKRNDTISHLRFPIPDGGVTSVDRMRSILDAIDLSHEANRGVYVHCFGGMGRTGTIICCWLLRHRSVDRSNVLSVLTRLRQADKERASWKAPENAGQESFVLNWSYCCRDAPTCSLFAARTNGAARRSTRSIATMIAFRFPSRIPAGYLKQGFATQADDSLS